MSRREYREVRSARERAEKHKGGWEPTYLNLPKGAKLLKLEGPVMYLDVIPYPAGKGNPFADEGNPHYERTFYIHKKVGGGDDSYICLRRTARQPCPVCEFNTRLQNKGVVDIDDLKELAPKERQLFNVINTKDRDAGIQILEISYHLFGKLLDARTRTSDAEDAGWDMFHSLTEGCTLRLEIAEEKYGQGTYSNVTSIDFVPRKKQYDTSIYEEAYCLDECLKIPSYKELEKIVLEIDEDDPTGSKARESSRRKKDDDEDDRRSSKSKSKSSDDDDDDGIKAKPKASRSSKDDDDDDKPSKEDEDWDRKPSKSSKDDDDDDTPPKSSKRSKDDDDDEDDRRSSKSKSKSSDDDDDEDDRRSSKSKSKSSDDDDDEDDKPKRKSSFRDDPDDDDDSKSSRKASKSKSSDDDDDEDDKPVRRAKPSSKDDDDDDTPPKSSKRSKDDDDDEDDRPKGKRSRDDDDD